MKGSEFCDLVRHLPVPDRERAVYDAVARGDCYFGGCTTICEEASTRPITVADDYLAIGSALDFVRMPVSGLLAVRICALLGMRMPTVHEVDAIARAADVRLVPRPCTSWGAGRGGKWGDRRMLSVEWFEQHNQVIEQQLAHATRDLVDGYGLIAGHKKDVVGCDGKRVEIYGWPELDGHDIQPDSRIHEASYADYSHGLRLVVRE